MYNPKIGIIGVGWVGSQIKRYFEEIKGYKSGKDLFAYDIDPKRRVGDINKAEVVFVIVPTPRDAKTPFLVSIKRKDNVKIRATARARKKRGIAANDAGSTKKIIKARAVHEVRMIRKDKKKFFRNLALLDPLPLKISILPSF